MAGWCSRNVIQIRWATKRKSATLRTIVLALFDYRLMKHREFVIASQSELLLGQSKLSRLLTAAGPWYSQCAACMAPSCVNMAGPAAGGCQGVARPECRGPCRNSAKRSCLPWISTNGSLQIGERYHNTMTEASALACRRWTQAGWRCLRGRFDDLGVRPRVPTWRGYLELSFRWYQRFDQWLQLFFTRHRSH